MSQILISPLPYLWLGSIALGLLITSRFPKRRGSIRDIAAAEDGSSYTLPLAILTPLYTLLVCVVIECTLLLVVKIGVTQAAFAAARSASVWLTAEPVGQSSENELVGMVHLAAVNNLAPFGSSLDSHRVKMSAPPLARDYHRIYASRVDDRRKQIEIYSARKWESAFAGTEVSFDPPVRQLMKRKGRQHDEPVKVTVTYEMPFNIAAIGIFLGRSSNLPGANFYSRKISSSFELQLERPQSQSRTLGIEYDSFAENYQYQLGETR